MIDALRLLTQNNRDLNDPRKMRQVLVYLNRHNVQVTLLQETHLKPHKNNRFARTRAAHQSFSSYSGYVHGTAILIRKGIPHRLLEEINDPEGRYNIIRIVLGTKPLIIINTYGPNTGDSEFL